MGKIKLPAMGKEFAEDFQKAMDDHIVYGAVITEETLTEEALEKHIKELSYNNNKHQDSLKKKPIQKKKNDSRFTPKKKKRK